MHVTFYFRLFIYLVLGFIAATAIGTVSHELGHYVVGKALGYETVINFASAGMYPGQGVTRLHHKLFTLGGPVQTMLTGTIGFILMLYFKKSFYLAQKLSFRQWIILFIALFWLRQLANFCMSLVWYFMNGKLGRSDESRIDRYLDLQHGTISAITAFIAAMVLYIVVFRFIPSSQRFTFITAGLVGSAAGYYLWLHSLGQLIMP